ncbi:hypothetical protein [Stieleria mannarensis]|uniref:hypothetical protein n=1 Tax=Stieleria mannarensis TaxID=2755585 RepID=UPI00160327CC|nr:hypothetical protein [Rhodopirellula sp. JC639]
MSTSASPLSLQHPDHLGRVHFEWTADRFQHAIEFGAERIACRIGADGAAWPDSPPIQQLSIESIEGREVALGVGCAGTSHWSLSVEPTADGFRFDWACRVKETPQQLGTRYDGAAAIEIVPDDQSTVVVDDGSKRIQPSGPIASVGTFRWCYTVRAAS